MFSVLFEVHPKAEQWEAYLGYARMLRPELENIDGFVDNIRYRGLTRDGWILSLSGWRDEKALVRWRTTARHHDIQYQGREVVLIDYHLRVGQLTRDTSPPQGHQLREQRLDETETGQATTITLIDATYPITDPAERAAATYPSTDHAGRAGALDPERLADWLGLDRAAAGLNGWDVFDAVVSPGEVILLISWRDQASAEAFETAPPLPTGARVRRVRVVRDYGMFDRREAPQYYPDATTS